MSPYTTASAQIQLAACMKAAQDLLAQADKDCTHPEDQQRLAAARASAQQFDAILTCYFTGKTDFPPALLPLHRAINDVLTQAGHELNQGIPEGVDPEQAMARLEEGQAAITQAAIAGFMLLTHLARALAANSTTD